MRINGPRPYIIRNACGSVSRYPCQANESTTKAILGALALQYAADVSGVECVAAAGRIDIGDLVRAGSQRDILLHEDSPIATHRDYHGTGAETAKHVRLLKGILFAGDNFGFVV